MLQYNYWKYAGTKCYRLSIVLMQVYLIWSLNVTNGKDKVQEKAKIAKRVAVVALFSSHKKYLHF
ncbi:hypothetical protein GA0061070_10209 [Kosakonia oryziphila]|jgi:hypothetical protein|uniref:Uncharacterized protein n=1 Tax=Kosakonia oryziphila TaxID=1005667 RepID=A0A1C4E225_9ENTR|nr:hypothetical protein GA0061070_10209 [Kosakonia oryziphila]